MKKKPHSTIQSVVSAALADAVSFIDDDIGPDRAKALDYYYGRPFGDEQEGRSQIVSRDVHDMVSAALPSLMRVFFGGEHVVEFEPFGPEDEAEAEQKTDYVNYIITQDNDGFELFYAVIKDALRGKVGIAKSWWDDSKETCTRTYTGLDETALALLMLDLGAAQEAEIVDSSDGKGGLNVTIRLTKRVDRVRVAAVPPEEFLISRNAVSLDTAPLVAHRSLKTVSDLIAMGYDREVIEAGVSDDLDWNEERLARNPSLTEGDDSMDPSMREVLYVEAYIRSDQDGDGIAELRRVCCVGSTYRVVSDKPVDDHPFADFPCDPEPHTFFGESLADKVMDVQLTKSRLMRAGLDGLAQAVFPRTVVGRGGNVEDAMNTEVGAILRAEGNVADAYYFAAAPDTSRAVLPFVTYMDELRENRTGMSKVSMGLDAEALQNTTATAAEGNFTRSQERIELIARVMASGWRKLFRRIARLVSENQRAERMIRLRNKWVPIDPRHWSSDMNVICNVGLGGGSPAQRFQALSIIAAKQEAIMTQAGPDNPLCGVKQYHRTLSKMVQEAGFKNPDAFFTDPDSDEVRAMMAQKAQQGPPPDPKTVEAQAKMELEAKKAEAQMALEREKMAMQAEQARAELELKRAIAYDELAMRERAMEAEIALKTDAALNGDRSVSRNISQPLVGGDPG